MTINRTHLAPCPFCGGEPNLTHDDYVHDDLRPMPVVECKSCSAWVRAEDWNRRAQAQAAPEAEPVAVVAIDWPEYHYEAMGCGLEDRGITDRYEAMQHGWDCAMERCAEQLPDEPLMTVAQHNRIMASAPQHDAELVELIKELIDVDDGGLDDHWREHAGKELMTRIDAKLATLKVKP